MKQSDCTCSRVNACNCGGAGLPCAWCNPHDVNNLPEKNRRGFVLMDMPGSNTGLISHHTLGTLLDHAYLAYCVGVTKRPCVLVSTLDNPLPVTRRRGTDSTDVCDSPRRHSESHAMRLRRFGMADATGPKDRARLQLTYGKASCDSVRPHSSRQPSVCNR
jgi:hypothetical protein